MKITEDLRIQLRIAAARCGGAGEFSRLCGVNAANISRYLSGRVHSISDDNWNKLEKFLQKKPQKEIPYPMPPPMTRDTIRNTPELRAFLERNMRTRGITSASALMHLAGYDQLSTVERLLGGELNWFPDLLSAVLDVLQVNRAELPVTAAEQELLSPPGFFDSGAVLVRPVPVVDWANAASHLELYASDSAVMQHWDTDSTETVPVPVGCRRDTRAFRVCGVSMEPRIIDNDILLVEPVENMNALPNNKIIIAKFLDTERFPEQVVCKRVHHQPGGSLLLTSDNPEGKIICADPADLSWAGVVVRKITEL